MSGDSLTREPLNPCSQPNCTAEGEYRPVLVLHPKRGSAVESIRITLNQRVCRKHKRKLQITKFIHTAIWPSCRAEFKRMTGIDPAPERTGLDYVLADSIEAEPTLVIPADLGIKGEDQPCPK